MTALSTIAYANPAGGLNGVIKKIPIVGNTASGLLDTVADVASNVPIVGTAVDGAITGNNCTSNVASILTGVSGSIGSLTTAVGI